MQFGDRIKINVYRITPTVDVTCTRVLRRCTVTYRRKFAVFVQDDVRPGKVRLDLDEPLEEAQVLVQV